MYVLSVLRSQCKANQCKANVDLTGEVVVAIDD